MCRCLMAISAVSQHGPNPQAGPRRPDRSVSLPDPRETAAEMMGGLGNLPLKRLQKQRDDLIDRHERLKSDSPNAPFNQELDELLEAIDEVERQIRELDDPPPPPPPVEVLDLDDPAARKAALAKWGQRHVESVPDLPPDVHEMAGEPGRIGRSAPEGPTPPFEPLPELTEEERKRGKEAIEKIRRDNPNIVNPESTMDAAFLPGMFAQAAEQESQGYFGGVGDIVESVFEAVPDIDPRTAIAVAMAVAAAIAAGSGVGSPMVPLILGGGAALASQ
jgi:hypothetical protein